MASYLCDKFHFFCHIKYINFHPFIDYFDRCSSRHSNVLTPQGIINLVHYERNKGLLIFVSKFNRLSDNIHVGAILLCEFMFDSRKMISLLCQG